MGSFFEEIFHLAKTTEFSLKGGWRTNTAQAASEQACPNSEREQVELSYLSTEYCHSILEVIDLCWELPHRNSYISRRSP